MNGQRRSPHRTAWTETRRGLVATIVAVTLLGATGPVIGQTSPLPTASMLPGAALPRVSLAGPFGRLDGVPIASGDALPDPSLLRPVDAYGRDATLRAAPRDEDLLFLDWRLSAVAEPLAVASVPMDLGGAEGSGVTLASVKVPPTGVWVVRLDASLVQHDVSFEQIQAAGSWVWRVVVPDRDVPGDDAPYPPVPAINLASASRVIEMERGSGCYVGTCADVAFATPDQDLPRLEVSAGAPLILSLGDGSGLATWSASARPVGGPDADSLLLANDQLDVSRPVAVIPAPPSGRWVLEAIVGFDLERGSYSASARLRVP